MNSPRPDAGPRVTIVPHAPERSRRASVDLYCGCCCCCCCCLHTVGSIIGAAVGSVGGPVRSSAGKAYPVGSLRYKDMFIIPEERVGSSGAPAGAIYWWMVLALSFLGMMLALPAVGGDGAMVVLVVGALLFPALQLTASVLSCIAIAVSSHDDKPSCYRRIGRITGFSILGTIAGIGAMFFIGVMLGARC